MIRFFVLNLAFIDIADMAHVKSIESAADCATPSHKASSSISLDDVQRLFSLPELLCIDQMNNYLHDLTSNKMLHIATVCSDLFRRNIDEYMISYAISMIRNGIFPVSNPYRNLHEILNVSCNHLLYPIVFSFPRSMPFKMICIRSPVM